MANTVGGVNRSNYANSTARNQNSKKAKETDNKKSKSSNKVNDKTKTKPKDPNMTTDENGNVIKKGSYNDPDRKVKGLFEEEQLKWLDKIKDDPTTKRLVDNKNLGKEQFMHILLTQLANQNPLNPMEDKEFVAQMAEFSSLETMQSMNKNFEGIATMIQELKDVVSVPSESDVVLHASLAKLISDIQLIGKKLGVEFPVEDADDTEGTENAEGAEGTENAEGTEGTENAGGTENAETTDSTENSEGTENSGENGESADAETTTKKVNEEIKKEKAAKAYS